MVFYHNINPILVHIGPFQIRYYGLMYLLGFIIAYFMLTYLSKERGIRLTKDDIADYLTYTLIGIIVGARLFYILFYNLSYYLSNPIDMLAVWKGGLSFHGGLVGAILIGWWFSRKKKVHLLELADMVVLPLALGLMLGRIGNFINGELYGRITNMPWGVKFSDVEGFRHPSQLYESAKNLLIFTILWPLRRRILPRRGLAFTLFLLLYGGLRFLVEFFRAPDIQVGFVWSFLTMGQILSALMVIAALILLYLIKNQKI